MKTTRNLRKDVTFAQKFHYLAMAIDYLDIHRINHRTDLIGTACQFSSQPKLKRQDFDGIVDMKIADIAFLLDLKIKE